MRRRDFLNSTVAPLAPRLRLSGSQWIFRRYPGRVGETDPLRQLWRQLCPNTHRWFEAVAAESMPQTAVLAGFSSPEASRDAAPTFAEVFEDPQGGLARCSVLELREKIGGHVQCLLLGFESLAARWETRNEEVGRLALFKAERG